MERLVQDARFAARVLWKDRGFAATAILTLAICVGANAAIFAIVNSVLLQPLPVPHAEQLVYMYNAYPGAGVVGGSSGVTDYYDRLKQTDVFQEQALFNTRGVTLGGEAEPQRITAMLATPSLLRLLQVQPIRGRIFTDDEGEIGKTQKAVLTYAAWQAWFGGQDSAIGRDIRIGGEAYPVVGVLPQGFSFLEPEVKVWLPVAFSAEERADDNRHSNNWSYLARLKPGRTVEQARQQIDALNTRNLDIFPALKQILINAGFHTVVVPLPRLSRARREEHAVPALGRRGVRAAGGRRQRDQPDAGAIERADEGAGDAARARRGPAPHRASAADRSGAAGAGRRRDRARTGLRRCARAVGVRDGGDAARHAGHDQHGGDRLHVRAGAGARGPHRPHSDPRPAAHEPEPGVPRRRPLRHRRTRRARRAPRAGDGAGGVRLHAADRRRAAAGELPARARRPPGIRRQPRHDRPRQSAGVALQGRPAARRVLEPSHRSHSGAARRAGGGHHQEPSASAAATATASSWPRATRWRRANRSSRRSRARCRPATSRRCRSR